MTTEEKSLNEYLEMLRRRSVPGALTALLILGISIVIAVSLSDVYQSSATILIEQRGMPDQYIKSLTGSNASQYLEIINHRVMTNANLSKLIKKYGLYRNLEGKDEQSTLLKYMRRDILMDMLTIDSSKYRTNQDNQLALAFSLSFEHGSPIVAQQIANELASLFIIENAHERKKVVTDTSSFLTSEAEKLKSKISGLEVQIASFKSQNAGKLPELEQLNIRLLERAQMEVAEVNRQIITQEDRRVYLETELERYKEEIQLYSETGRRIIGPNEQLKILKTEFIKMDARYDDNHPDKINLMKQIKNMEREIKGVSIEQKIIVELVLKQEELTLAMEKYSEDHPDVIKLRREVDSLQKEHNKLKLSQTLHYDKKDNIDNPAYIQTQARLASANSELSRLRTRKDELESKLALYEKRLIDTPEVERAYRKLLRDYEGFVKQYQDVVKRQMEAQMAESLEQDTIGEYFSIIEPPIVPGEPVRPNRTAIGFLGIVLALIGYIAGASVAESLDRTIRGRKGVAQQLGELPLAIIPYIETDAEKKQAAYRQVIIKVLVISFIIISIVIVTQFIKSINNFAI